MMTNPNALIHRARFGQFISVGGIGAMIETAFVALLTTLLGIGPLAAKAVGAEISISTMFVINDRWTFASEGNGGIPAFLRRWGKSHLIRVVGLGIAFSVLYLLTNMVDYTLPIAGVDLWPTVANLIGIGAGMVLNYAAESIFTGRLPHKPHKTPIGGK